MFSKVWDEFTYPFSKSNGFWKFGDGYVISFDTYIECNHMLGLKLEKWGPSLSELTQYICMHSSLSSRTYQHIIACISRYVLDRKLWRGHLQGRCMGFNETENRMSRATSGIWRRQRKFMTLEMAWRTRPLQLVLSGGPVTPIPIREYNGLRGENRYPSKDQQASASNPVMWHLSRYKMVTQKAAKVGDIYSAVYTYINGQWLT